VNLLHSLSLARYEALPDKKAREGVKISRPKPQAARFINQRALMPNLLFSTDQWNVEVNKLDAVVKPTCFNRIKHDDPVTFEDNTTMFSKSCYGIT
jgi:hypothetical protein